MENLAIYNAVPQEIIENVLLKQDLAGLTPDQRIRYYQNLCNTLGLNPLTRPFEYITFTQGGKTRMLLYVTKAGAAQLRTNFKVSVSVTRYEEKDGLFIVEATAKLPDGREDTDIGVVPIPPNIPPDAKANLLMKAFTKAKRRVTLSIIGLGFLDESELDTIPDAHIPQSASATLDVKMIEQKKQELEVKVDSVPTASAIETEPAEVSVEQPAQKEKSIFEEAGVIVTDEEPIYEEENIEEPKLSTDERKAIMMVAKFNGWSNEQLKQLVKDFGFKSSAQMPKRYYEILYSIVSKSPNEYFVKQEGE
ncbi:MAG: hypothetical protein WHV28_09575 [Bacteroidota bacterium]